VLIRMSDLAIVSYNLETEIIEKLGKRANKNKRSASKELEVILEQVLK